MREGLRRLWRGWVEITAYVGDFQARLLLTVFYFTVAAPFGVIARLLDPLAARPRAQAGWVARKSEETSLPAARRQF